MTIVGRNEAESSKRRRIGESSGSREQREDQEQEESEDLEEQLEAVEGEEQQEEDDEEEEEEDDEEQGEQELEEVQDDDRIAITVDRYFLDCSICMEPLRPSIKQCLNGHIVCSRCWKKLKNKCPVCNHVAVVRTIAYEKLLESAWISCKYKNSGCKKTVPYYRSQNHIESCSFGPSGCPIPNCTSKFFAGELHEHLVTDHEFPSINFKFNVQTIVKIYRAEPFNILVESESTPFLLARKPAGKLGHTVSLHRINPSSSHESENLQCALATLDEDGEEVLLQLKAKVGCIHGGKLVGPRLLVPHGSSPDGTLRLSIMVGNKYV